jgi:carnitine 3-dehydrogenase
VRSSDSRDSAEEEPCRFFGVNAGKEHVLEHFGPTLKFPWAKFEALELSDKIDRLIDGTRKQAAETSAEELEHRRDECLIETQDVTAKHWPL